MLRNSNTREKLLLGNWYYRWKAETKLHRKSSLKNFLRCILVSNVFPNKNEFNILHDHGRAASHAYFLPAIRVAPVVSTDQLSGVHRSHFFYERRDVTLSGFEAVGKRCCTSRESLLPPRVMTGARGAVSSLCLRARACTIWSALFLSQLHACAAMHRFYLYIQICFFSLILASRFVHGSLFNKVHEW